jgi:hypothetical protein
MTVHQQDSSQPQQSHSSPQEVLIGLGLTMEVMLETVEPGMLIAGKREICLFGRAAGKGRKGQLLLSKDTARRTAEAEKKGNGKR